MSVAEKRSFCGGGDKVDSNVPIERTGAWQLVALPEIKHTHIST